MVFIQYFVISFLLIELIFVNSPNFQIELFIDDIRRFLNVEELAIVYSYFSLLVALLTSGIFFLTKNIKDKIYRKIYDLTLYYLLINTLVTLSVFYFLRIYTISRLFLLLSLILFPLINLFIDVKLKNNPPIKYFVIILFTITSLYFVFNPVEEIEEDQTGYKPDSEEQNREDSKPIDYYPDLDMRIIESETDPLDYYPSFEKIVQEYKDYKNVFRAELFYDTKYKLKKYSICCYWLQYERSGGKPIGYLENYKNNLIYVHGTGIFSYTKKSDLIKGEFEFNIIESNFHEIINNKFLYERNPQFNNGSNGWESIRDLLIVNDKVYVSFVNQKSENCVNVEILFADLNYKYLNFDYFFTNNECVMRTDYPLYNAMVAGGKLLNMNNESVFFATGDFRNWEKAQDENSYLGKVLSIDINTSEYKIISKGHRNPQGLSLTKYKNFLIETEHGPVGGDEINLIEINKSQNFGWPISSYGKHWFPENYEMKDGIATLHDSHSDYGMREPLFYQYVGYFGGIGISDVEINYFNDLDAFFVATLNGGQIFDIEANIEENKMNSFTRYKINERIRDMEYDPDNRVYYLLLENGPSIGIFSENK